MYAREAERFTLSERRVFDFILQGYRTKDFLECHKEVSSRLFYLLTDKFGRSYDCKIFVCYTVNSAENKVLAEERLP